MSLSQRIEVFLCMVPIFFAFVNVFSASLIPFDDFCLNYLVRYSCHSWGGLNRCFSVVCNSIKLGEEFSKASTGSIFSQGQLLCIVKLLVCVGVALWLIILIDALLI